jgi:L-alanine-DL-glutamate epimerase-like enolase superfamily enzyme
MGLTERVQALSVEIGACSVEPLRASTRTGWVRHTTVVRLRGPGGRGAGLGEDITYEADEHRAFQAAVRDVDVRGRFTLAGFSRHLDTQPLFVTPPARRENELYRRWAFESAALDLALQQAGKSLASLLGRSPAPVRYVVSTGLGSPPGVEGLDLVRRRFPGARFKVDYSEEWTADTVRKLAAFGGIDTVDLKAHYHGSFEGPDPEPEMYRCIAEVLPDCWLEDPAWTGGAWQALAGHRDRITWDAVLHSLADLVQLPAKPRCVNIKPSRFGSVAELMRVYDHCRDQDIGMYGGGQFELGPGRGQVQYLASLFHPDAGNDVAPAGFNQEVLPPDLPASPLEPCPAPTGFRWRE